MKTIDSPRRITSDQTMLGYEIGLLEAAEAVDRIAAKLPTRSSHLMDLVRCAATLRQKARDART